MSLDNDFGIRGASAPGTGNLMTAFVPLSRAKKLAFVGKMKWFHGTAKAVSDAKKVKGYADLVEDARVIANIEGENADAYKFAGGMLLVLSTAIKVQQMDSENRRFAEHVLMGASLVTGKLNDAFLAHVDAKQAQISERYLSDLTGLAVLTPFNPKERSQVYVYYRGATATVIWDPAKGGPLEVVKVEMPMRILPW